MLASLALVSCHPDWEEIYAECLNSRRCVSAALLPALEFSPGALAFPDTSVGSQSGLSLTLVNNTATPQSPVFVISGPFRRDSACETIGARSPCTFTVNFSPGDAGVFTGVLSAGIGALPDDFNVSVALEGNGT